MGKKRSSQDKRDKCLAAKRIISACGELESALKAFEDVEEEKAEHPDEKSGQINEWLVKVKAQIDDLSK